MGAIISVFNIGSRDPAEVERILWEVFYQHSVLFLFVFVCVWVLCLHVCLYTICVPST